MQMQTFAQQGTSGFFVMSSNAKRKLKNSVFHSARLQSICVGAGPVPGRAGGHWRGGPGQGGTFLLLDWQMVLVSNIFF